MIMRRAVAPFFEPTKGGVLAPLLVVALLFCHGALGALHQVCDLPDHSHLSGEHPSHASGEDPGGHSGAHLGCSDYAAVLVSILSLAAVGLLLLVGPRVRSALAAFRLTKRSFPPLVLHPPRGPTAPTLQVFRL